MRVLIEKRKEVTSITTIRVSKTFRKDFYARKLHTTSHWKELGDKIYKTSLSKNYVTYFLDYEIPVLKVLVKLGGSASVKMSIRWLLNSCKIVGLSIQNNLNL